MSAAAELTGNITPMAQARPVRKSNLYASVDLTSFSEAVVSRNAAVIKHRI